MNVTQAVYHIWCASTARYTHVNIYIFFFFCVPKAMLRCPVLFSPGNLLSVEGTPSVPKVSRLGPLDMARFLVSGCYVMGRTEECVQVFENLYHMDIHQCGQV